MRYQKFFFLSYLALPLASCTSITTSAPDVYLARNGDSLFGSINATYSSSGTLTDYDSLKIHIDGGEEVLLLLTSASCMGCMRLEPSFASAMINGGHHYYYLHNNGDIASYEQFLADTHNLYEDYPELNDYSLGTPMLISLTQESAKVYDIFRGNDSAVYWGEAKLSSYFENLLGETKIYNFTTLTALDGFLSENPNSKTYLLDSEDMLKFYENDLYQEACATSENVAILSYTDEISLTYFGIEKYHPGVYQGGSFTELNLA